MVCTWPWLARPRVPTGRGAWSQTTPSTHIGPRLRQRPRGNVVPAGWAEMIHCPHGVTRQLCAMACSLQLTHATINISCSKLGKHHGPRHGKLVGSGLVGGFRRGRGSTPPGQQAVGPRPCPDAQTLPASCIVAARWVGCSAAGPDFMTLGDSAAYCVQRDEVDFCAGEGACAAGLLQHVMPYVCSSVSESHGLYTSRGSPGVHHRIGDLRAL